LAVIEIEHLHYAYPSFLPGGEPVGVLRGVDLSVERGEFLAIMGATGVGKSTLCMAVNGIVPQSTGGVIRGRVSVLGHDTRSTPVAELATHVGMVFQDPESQLFCASVESEVAFGPESLGIHPEEIAERVAWALKAVDMESRRHRSPTQLSGGQKQRVAIAAALAMLPEVLVLDEPTCGLDPIGKSEVFAVIEGLCEQESMTIVMVSQDAEHIARFADRVAVMYEGRVARLDEPRCVFEDAGLLEQAGIAAPQVTQVAGNLNQRYGSAYHFVLLGEAERALSHDLRGAPAW